MNPHARWARPSEDRVPAIPPPGHHQWTVEGIEPSSAGCKPTVFPLDDTPSYQGSGPGGGRTHIPLLKRQVLRRLSYKAIEPVCRAGVEPAQQCGWVTATWARQCPADTSSVPWMGFEPTISTLRAWRPLRAGTARVSGRPLPAGRVPGGSRTRTPPVHSRVPQPLWVRPQCSNLESNQELGLRRAA